MYKLLLCLRYLRTRYIALASIISVMLGVATMIVVNSVMAGFSSEMRDRIHGILADVVVESTSLDGTPDPERQMAVIRKVCGDKVEAMTATVEVYGMISFQYHGQWITRPVTLVGIKPDEKARVGPLVDYLDSYNVVRERDPDTREMVVVRQPLRSRATPPSWQLTKPALARRLQWANREQLDIGPLHRDPIPDGNQPNRNGRSQRKGRFIPPGEAPPSPFDSSKSPRKSNPDGAASGRKETKSLPFDCGPFDDVKPPERKSGKAAPPAKSAPAKKSAMPKFADDGPKFGGDHQQPVGDPIVGDLDINSDPSEPLEGRVYIGMGLISFPFQDPKTGQVKTVMMVQPGDDIQISTVNAGRPPSAVHFPATVVDVFKSGMSEYDSSLVFCNLEYLQQVRGMVDPSPPFTRSVTSIQIKLKNYEDADEVVKQLRAAFPPGLYAVRTWEQKQGPLLAAVEVESAILNVLLFLIIAVAGFGILAIFFMIVVEKTRDIGILKALGASSNGVMSIFLSYGFALGIVGSGVGVGLGLLFVAKINSIEKFITWVTGRKVFDEKIYYFPEIPTLVNPTMVLWVAAGAMLIAVLASILPARRASRLHPVEALRYE
jgi:lipoprotein-releasing system permease protein